jgi:hypothetical protein
MIVLKNSSGLYLSQCLDTGKIFNSQVENAIVYGDSAAAQDVNDIHFSGALTMVAIPTTMRWKSSSMLKAKTKVVQNELVAIIKSFKAKFTTAAGKTHQETINKALVVKIAKLELMVEGQEARIDALSKGLKVSRKP